MAGVYALIGSDSFLQLQELGKILDKAGKNAQRIDFEGDRAELADVLDELRSFAMFGGDKVVVVRNADDFIDRFREPMEDYVSNPSNSATLVLRFNTLAKNLRIYKALQKTGTIIDCEAPKDLVPWIIKRAKDEHKVTIDLPAANALKDLIGENLGLIDGELGKLALASTTNKITAQDVTGVAFQREQEIWELTNALATGDIPAAIKRWRQLLQMDPSAEFRAITWIGIWLENVRKALAMKKKGMPVPAIGKALRLWNIDIFKWMKTAETMGEEGAARAIELLVEVDKQSKSGIGSMAENVERFILSMAPQLR